MNLGIVISYVSLMGLLITLFAEPGGAATNNSSQQVAENRDLHCVKCHSAYQPECSHGTIEQLQSMSSECQYKNLSPQARWRYDLDDEDKAWRCLKVVQNVPGKKQIVFRDCAFMLPEQARKEENYCRYRPSGGTNARICYCKDNLCNSAMSSLKAAGMPLPFVAILLPLWFTYAAGHNAALLHKPSAI